MAGMFEGSTEHKEFELCPDGKFPGILYLVVDCGSHKDSWEGVERVKHQIYVAWELIGTAMKDGRPFVIGKTFNVTNGEFGPYFAKTSNMNKLLRAWTGKDEKTCSKTQLLGQLLREEFPAQITVEHEQSKKDPSKTYAVIESIKPYKGKDKPRRANEPVVYSLGQEMAAVPEWLQRKIGLCLENNGGVAPWVQAPKAELDPNSLEDVPF